LKKNGKSMEYIDLFGTLELDDFYRTDIHWSQDRILEAADRLLEAMGNDFRPSLAGYAPRELYPFYGSYYGHAAVSFKPDKLVYLTGEAIEAAEVYDPLYNEYSRVYMPEKFQGIDPYDVFLSGARPVLVINNKMNQEGKELVIFRDSFGSSLAPLLIEGYSKIILIDLRYISSSLLGKYTEFQPEQDILFIYSAEVLNNSAMLK